jgi:hypothetical protein
MMETELTRAHTKLGHGDLDIRALQDTISELRGQAQGESEIPHHKIAIVNYCSLKRKEKQQLIENYDQRLKEACQKFDGESIATQDKLTAAFEIASSLRKLLDDKELHVHQLLTLKVCFVLCSWSIIHFGRRHNWMDAFLNNKRNIPRMYRLWFAQLTIRMQPLLIFRK